MVYYFCFTNVNAIKMIITENSAHEWGIISNVIMSADKDMEWKLRLKALQVMIPTENMQSAKELVAKLFSQSLNQSKYKSLADCYMYVSN